jgi:putative tryptophan/tyrosine transport system substrate-binding protein
MRRRAFVSGALALFAAPLSAEAQQTQQTGRLPRIGVLFPAEPISQTEPDAAAFREGLRDLGYVEGQNIAVEYRHAHGKAELYSELLAELVRLEAKTIVVGSAAATLAAKKATQTIPIITVGGGDPVHSEVVLSIARPTGNVTGLVFEAGPEIFGKYVELLAETVPRLSRIAGIVDPRDPRNTYATHWTAADVAAKRRGIVLQQVDIRSAEDTPRAFRWITDQHSGAAIVFSGPFLYSLRKQISDHALKNGLPTISGYREGPEAGGLMSYGPSLSDLWRRAASYVDRILKGAKPADLPIEQPTKFELVINLKTAKALGLTLPPSLLLRADQVIE